MKLTKVTIHKYKSFSSEQNFDVEDDITVLVGMNESGKTSVLETIAKTNYFQEDEEFKFNATPDYPRKELKKIKGQNPKSVTCFYEIDEDILNEIKENLGEGVFTQKIISLTTYYDGTNTILMGEVNVKKFIKHEKSDLPNSSKFMGDKLNGITCQEEWDSLNQEYLKTNPKWNNPLQNYIYREFLNPNLPKFLYYDEYYALPSRINIEKMQGNQMEKLEEKTAKALFEVANIDLKTITQSNDFENLIAELEATSISISETMFEYWTTNKNLNIVFSIDPSGNQHVLDIRVEHNRVSLPLGNRSKGFNWFFSFLIWFTKIQEDKNSNYILLLDEPGLNLHASAQNDLLRFFEDLKETYQIIYTTHSPFMISPRELNRVRTVQETDEGSVISANIQRNDPNTLFPLQAALGYDIAQNLFISQNNLLVEGVADLAILTTMSAILDNAGRGSLNDDITIVPVGGMDKVSTFVSLLRGSELNIACLLDSQNFPQGDMDKVNNSIKEKLIKESNVRYYDKYVDDYEKADLEDLFDRSDYLKLFNLAFKGKYPEIKVDALKPEIQSILIQINQIIKQKRFNHYSPAQKLIQLEEKDLSLKTLDNFENVFNDINSIFSKSRSNNKK